jgi:hypothetical protein
MQVLLKAPRGLANIYGLLYFIFYLVIRKLIPNRAVVLLFLGIALGYQFWNLEKQVYRYSYSSYPQVAAYLLQHNIKKVATTVGRGIIPPAWGKGIAVKVVFAETELPALKAAGYRYVLQDNYYRATNIQQFNQLEKLPALKTWRNPAVIDPLLYLDHAEFTGLSFAQTLALHQKSTRDTLQLRLLRIP